MSQEIVATKEDPDVNSWDPRVINQVLFKYEETLKEKDVEFYITVKEGTGDENTPAKNVRLCWKDLSQRYLDYHLDPENVFGDSHHIQNGTVTFKDLPASVYGESFVNESGQLLLPDPTPVDLTRFLEDHNTKELHTLLQEALRRIGANPDGIQAHIFNVNTLVKGFAERFYERGIKIFVCSQTQDVIVGGRHGHIFFSWVEYVDYRTMFYQYAPAELVRELA